MSTTCQNIIDRAKAFSPLNASLALVLSSNSLIVRATGVSGKTLGWLLHVEPHLYTP